MDLIGQAALEGLSGFWVLQSAGAVIKTRKARRLFLNHRRWLERNPRSQPPARVAVIIAMKGVSDSFGRFMDFALGQDHPDHRLIFVTEATDDPVYSAIAARIAGVNHARLIVAGRADRCGQKVHNQLAAFRVLEPADRLLAFADGDLSGSPDWLTGLVTPLDLAQADFTCGYRWFIPANQRLPNRFIALLGTAIEPWIGPNWRMCLWGGSMAMSREVFEELEIAKNLEGCINDDARISQLARRVGKRMRYVRSVAAPSPVDFTWASLLEFGRRQYFQLRIYQPMLWWMALLIALGFLTSFTTCFARLAAGDLLMLVPIAAAIALNLARTRIRRAYLRDRFGGGELEALDAAVAGSGWLDPVIQAIHLVILISSACGREIVWAGIRYRLRGPQETEVVSRL